MTPLSARRDWLTDVGLLVAALAAITSSGAALAGLARLAGWSAWLALMLPATIDLYAITATRIWLSRRTASERVKQYARANALAGIAASVVGNAAYHALVAEAVRVPRWVLVVAVSMVPPTVIGALAHLVALRSGGPESRRTSSRRTAREAPADHGARPDRSARKAVEAKDRTKPEGARRSAATAEPVHLAEAAREYRTSVERGEPLSERKLADRFGQSRRWARKVIDTARRDGELDADVDAAERPHLTLAATKTTGGTR